MSDHGLLAGGVARAARDRKSTRLNSSHSQISYAVFCLKKKTKSVQAAMTEKGQHPGLATGYDRHTPASMILVETDPSICADTAAISSLHILAYSRSKHN